MPDPFFHELNDIFICIKCNSDFKAYDYWEDCHNCNDGETDDGKECYACGGYGTLEYVEKKICQDCLYIQLTRDE